jgi:hypothetical protein
MSYAGQAVRLTLALVYEVDVPIEVLSPLPNLPRLYCISGEFSSLLQN